MVTIRPVTLEDAPVVQELATSHPDIVKQTRLPDQYPDDGAEQWIKTVVPKHQRGEEFCFSILNEDEVLVGLCGLKVKNDKKEVELGYWIGQPYWNQGYATGAIQQALRFSFEAKSFRRVFAITLDHNTASRKVLEKNGFTFVKYRPDDKSGCNTGGTVAVYEILKESWYK